MYRKIGLIVCTWVLAMAMGTGVYAGTVNLNTADTIEILKPEVGTEGDVVLKKDTLYVNLRLTGKSVVYMSLHRIDPEFYLGSQPMSEDAVMPEGEFSALSQEQKLEYRRAIFARKTLLEARLGDSRREFDAALALVRKEFGDVAKMELQRSQGLLTPTQTALGDRFRAASQELQANRTAYAAAKALYDKAFTRVMFGPSEVKATDILMTYQTEIQEVKPGNYILVFSEKSDGTQIIKTLAFKGETSEKTVEKILDTLPENRTRLFVAPSE